MQVYLYSGNTATSAWPVSYSCARPQPKPLKITGLVLSSNRVLVGQSISGHVNTTHEVKILRFYSETPGWSSVDVPGTTFRLISPFSTV